MISKGAVMKCSWIIILLVGLLSCLSLQLRTNRAESVSRSEDVSVLLKPAEAVVREMGKGQDHAERYNQ